MGATMIDVPSLKHEHVLTKEDGRFLRLPYVLTKARHDSLHRTSSVFCALGCSVISSDANSSSTTKYMTKKTCYIWRHSQISRWILAWTENPTKVFGSNLSPINRSKSEAGSLVQILMRKVVVFWSEGRSEEHNRRTWQESWWKRGERMQE